MEGENGAGIKKHNWQGQNRQGEVKNSIGTEEAKELACMTHGHELKGRDCWKEGVCRVEEGKGEKQGQL